MTDMDRARAIYREHRKTEPSEATIAAMLAFAAERPGVGEEEAYEIIRDDDGADTGYRRDKSTGEVVTLDDEDERTICEECGGEGCSHCIALVPTQRLGWKRIDSAPMWQVAIVTDGENVARAQKAETDYDGFYWAVDSEDALEWEPTHWIEEPDSSPPPSASVEGELSYQCDACTPPHHHTGCNCFPPKPAQADRDAAALSPTPVAGGGE